ncbi:MAG: winged helix-turn-helix domain-containing protein [Anaerolineae bacterium]
MCWLRRKIEPAPQRPIYLQTVRGQGYRLVLPPESHAPPAR